MTGCGVINKELKEFTWIGAKLTTSLCLHSQLNAMVRRTASARSRISREGAPTPKCWSENLLFLPICAENCLTPFDPPLLTELILEMENSRSHPTNLR